MEKNQIIGFILLFATLFLWTWWSAPSEEELKEAQRVQDSIAQVKALKDSLTAETKEIISESNLNAPSDEKNDSMSNIKNTYVFGLFAPAASGVEKFYTLENDEVVIKFSNKGGRIVSATLKNHIVSQKRKKGEPIEEKNVVLLGNERNKFEYLIPVKNVPSGTVNTRDLYFDVTQQGNALTFKAKTLSGGAFVQKYKLGKGFNLDYDIDYSGLKGLLDGSADFIKFHWENYLAGYEKNRNFEKRYSAVYYKEKDQGDIEDCGCMKDDKEDLKNTPLEWVSHVNQYFNSSLISRGAPFASGEVESISPDDVNGDYIEMLRTDLDIPIQEGSMDMEMYIGPNKYKELQNLNVDLEYVVPFGSSIFGTINRYLIRPVFNFFNGLTGSLGLSIIIIIFLLKMILYPLMYKMLHSQALMGALKPQLEPINKKFADDPQKKQIETMKIYREYGVSPLGGCLPMIIQMPIWYALFRFFPASFLFRREPFLWADDLSSYDDFFHLSTTIPFIGDHISLFTVLYSISMLIYTYYNSKNMDMSANPAMKYMQYFMPIMFFGFFNNYASALTCYMFFSNTINIAQTVITKKFVFTDERLQAELKKKKAKPKKKSAFASKFEEALKQQQAAQAAQKKRGKK